MINAVLIDDDAVNISILKELLYQNCPEVCVCGEAYNARDGVTVINDLKPDLVFLDIEMPYGNAFDLLQNLVPVTFDVIFITAFGEYALQAIKYSALDYLLKPINADELKLAVQKAGSRVNAKSINQQIENLVSFVSHAKDQSRKLAVPVKNGFEFVEVNEIIHCCAINNYTQITTSSGKKYLSPRTLTEYEELTVHLSFFRIHHAHLVNLNFIRKYVKDGRKGGFVILTDGTTVEVATRRKEEFMSMLLRG